MILSSFDALQYRFDKLKSGELELGYECQSGAAGKIRKFNSTLKLACKAALTSFAPLG